jgi:hypothetical protein
METDPIEVPLDDLESGERFSRRPLDNETASLLSGMDKEQQLQREQLEDLQTHTIYALVENTKVECMGKGCNKKLLFLSTRQAKNLNPCQDW